jgi:hypothetical protein
MDPEGVSASSSSPKGDGKGVGLLSDVELVVVVVAVTVGGPDTHGRRSALSSFVGFDIRGAVVEDDIWYFASVV